jgi:hypothetical protein
MIMLGMIIGSLVGGYVPVLMGADSISISSLFGSLLGGILGIYLAWKYTN